MDMEMIIVAIMAVLMVGAGIWCWRIENRGSENEKN